MRGGQTSHAISSHLPVGRSKGECMKVLLKREQRPGLFGRVSFKLWAMLEVDDDEKALIERYDIDESMVIQGYDEGLWKRGALVGVFGALLVFFIVNYFLYDLTMAGVAALLAWMGTAYWWVNEKRETIYLKDLLHGRSFKCISIIDLAKKEAKLDDMCQALRQVIESAKHWDGVEHRDVIVLPPEEAKDFIVKAFY